jgi:hypothetical protein
MKKMMAAVLSLCLLMGMCFGTIMTASAEVTPDTVVTAEMVPDEMLYEAMVNAVWMMGDEEEPPESITCGDLANLVYLEVYNYIGEEMSSSLKGLELCTSLESLYIEGVTLTDDALDTIAQTAGLTELFLPSCGITDWSALTALVNLETLDLSGNAITDLSPMDEFDVLPLICVTDNRLDMTDAATVAYVDKLIPVAEAKLPTLMEQMSDELDELAAQLEMLGVTMDMEAAFKALLPMFINASQMPQDGELVDADSVKLYVRKPPVEELLAAIELPEGEELPDVSGWTELLLKTVDGKPQSLEEETFTVIGTGPHTIALYVDTEKLAPLLQNLIAEMRTNEEVRAMIEDMLRSLSDLSDISSMLDGMTDDEVFELLFTVDEDGYVWMMQEVPVTDENGEPIYREDVQINGAIMTIGGEPTDLRAMADEMYGDSSDIPDEELFYLFFYYDENDALIFPTEVALTDEDGTLLTKADMLDEDGNLTLYGETMPLRDYAEMVLGGYDIPPAFAIFDMDEDGYLLDEDGKRVLDENGQPIKAVDMLFDILEEEMPTLLENLNEMLFESSAVTFYLREYGSKGDVNGDRNIDSSDARVILQAAVGKAELNDVQTAMADVNGDDSVDSSDARMVLQYAVGKITAF